jgi:polyisoprenoid-binding protein YceI
MANLAFATALTSVGGDVKFTAVGKPGFLKIRGESKSQFPIGSLKFDKDSAAGEFEFDLQGLETGIDLRNEHMKDKYLEVAKFPKSKLTFKLPGIKESDLSSDLKRNFVGILNLHGVTKEVSGEVLYSAATKSAVTKFTIKVSDFGIDIPKYMGITVSETVDLDVSVKFN